MTQDAFRSTSVGETGLFSRFRWQSSLLDSGVPARGLDRGDESGDGQTRCSLSGMTMPIVFRRSPLKDGDLGNECLGDLRKKRSRMSPL